MEKTEDKIKLIKEELINLNKRKKITLTISEGNGEKCSREETDAIRMVFNLNPTVKWTFKSGIDKILKDVFSDNYYDVGEYSEGSSAGIYDLEGDGRSIINKLNTNYNCFCVLMRDVNRVLLSEKILPIQMIGIKPYEQVNETKRLLGYVENYKNRIFSVNSQSLHNLMRVLKKTNSLGNNNETATISILKKHFGENNINTVGGLGNMRDMVDGIDCEITVDGNKLTGQIKPYTYKDESESDITLFGTGSNKIYKTDWMIFYGKNKGILIFNNKNVKIINGQYVFPKEDLIYSLS